MRFMSLRKSSRELNNALRIKEKGGKMSRARSQRSFVAYLFSILTLVGILHTATMSFVRLASIAALASAVSGECLSSTHPEEAVSYLLP